MGKIIEEKIVQFKPMSSNVRDGSGCALSSHFSLFRTGKLSPNVSYTSLTDAGEKIVKFLYARGYEGSTVGYYLYGFGAVAGATAYPKIFRLSLGDTAWTFLTDSNSSTGVRAENVFFEYKDALYYWQNGNSLTQIKDLNTDESPTRTDSWQTIPYTNVAQPVHHKADDYAYFFYDNKVCRFTGATATTVWTSDVLTLPSNMKIVGGASYGNYLAIICSPLELGATNSVMYLWDRDSSISTLTQKIDLGMGEVIHVSEAEDGGIWITQQARRTSGLVSKNNYISVKYYNGYLYNLDIPCGMPVDYFSDIKLTGNAWEERGVFYFPIHFTLTSASTTQRNAIAAVRRNGTKLEMILDQEISGVTDDQYINGIFSVGGIWHISYDTAAKTLQAKVASLFSTGSYETQIFNNGDAGLTKKLIGVTVITSPMPITSTCSLYYRKDEETAWTLIFTKTATAAGSVSHSAINIESSGANLPEYKEIQFKINSTVGCEIIGLKFRSEIISKDLYD